MLYIHVSGRVPLARYLQKYRLRYDINHDIIYLVFFSTYAGVHMALTNVWRRKTDGEWVRTNALQADREYDETVQAVAGHFRCYSCFHYVAFVNGKSKPSYLIHSSGDVDKNCEDRSQSTCRTAICSI